MMCTIMSTTAQSWSNNLPSYPPDNRHSSDVVCWRERGVSTVRHDLMSGGSEFQLRVAVTENACTKLFVLIGKLLYHWPSLTWQN